MAILKDAVNHVRLMLGQQEASEVCLMAEKAEKLERKWTKRAEELNEELLLLAIEELEAGSGKGRMERLLIEFLMDHMVEISKQSIEASKKRKPVIPDGKRLAKPGKSLLYWMKVWDEWRLKRKPTKAIKKQANAMMKEYLKATQSWYRRASEPLRRGEIQKKDLGKALAQQVKAPLARAKTIVNTETTKYWNEGRQAFYGGQEQVTHFLFVAIRDHRTTPWCKTRHGLVYDKDDPEIPPPLHYNCRSEILPLTPLSSRHQTLIQDKSRARRNNRPEPLPKGWKR